MLGNGIEKLHHLMHVIVWVHYPEDHRWMLPIFVLVLVIAPAWMGWHVLRFTLSVSQRAWRARSSHTEAVNARPSGRRHSLEHFVLRSTWPTQARLVALSVMTIPTAYVLLLLPKQIVDNVLDDDASGMRFLGLFLGEEDLLFALSASYLVLLTLNSLVKYVVNVVRSRANERIVRRIRLAVIRRRRKEGCARGRSTLAAVAIQECEPIGYFGSGLVVEPLLQGGTLLTSLVFLLMQDVALALAALMMLPMQIAVLPPLQRRINAKVRQRVHATRSFNAALSHELGIVGGAGSAVSPTKAHACQAETLEQVRLEISELKARFKGIYNYTSSLTPFFFFSIGGYLVLQQRLTLGALVAALAAYREIAPALRELFDFSQNWSDARARYVEIVSVLKSKPVNDSALVPAKVAPM
jgi:ABC-type bacteriocin/lantibiotic exporter with double-glycine peptidase domain